MTALSELLCRETPLRVGGSAVYRYKPMLERRYRFISRFGEEVLLHRREGEFIHLPRALCPLGGIDERSDGERVLFPQGPTPRPHQVQLFQQVAALVKQGLSGVVAAPTGWGKSCHPDEPVLMYDGSIKKACDVQEGDRIMGPDSQPRNVTNVNFGYGPMVRVIPTKGEPWVCNDEHILSLRCTSDNDYGFKGQVVNVTVKEWFTWCKSKRHVYKLWRTGVDFPLRPLPQHEPYLVGAYLGDGFKHTFGLSLGYLKEAVRQAFKNGVPGDVREVADVGKVEIFFSQLQSFWDYIRPFVAVDRRVPPELKVGSRATRLAVLAGLLDTDGHLRRNDSCTFDWVSLHRSLADDCAFIARSLGLAAYVKRCEKGCQTGAVGTYWRVSVSGQTSIIPTRVPCKQALVRRQKKNVLNTGFTIERIGDGEYRGIALDGDHLYLLGDFTVTHNTLLGYHAAYVAQRKTLVITTKDDIYKQWIEGACGLNGKPNFLGLQPHEVGEIRQDKCEVVGTKFVVAMIHSLSIAGKYPDWITKDFGVVIVDETHRLPAQQFSVVADMFPAEIRLGLSATPDRADGKELLIYAHLGPLRAKAEAAMVTPKVLRFNTGWRVPRVLRTISETGARTAIRIPHVMGKTAHIEKMMATDPARNQQIASVLRDCHAKGRKTVVFSTLLDHVYALRHILMELGVPEGDIGHYGQASTQAQREAREAVKVKPVILTTYGMCAEGTDIPWLDVCVFAIPRAHVAQPAGRVLREYPNKPQPVVIDFVDDDSPVFAGYARRRLAWYEKIGAPVFAMN